MPRVAVIIPTFNRRSLVREAVRSALSQTFADREVVVVDDGSTDGTADALHGEFGTAIRILVTSARGVSAARNAGVRATRSPLLAFLDSDDLWQPQKLAAQWDFFEADPQAVICQTEEIWIRNGTRVNPRHRHRKSGGDLFLASLHLCLVSPSAVMMRRELFEAVGGFDESLPACEDYDLWLRVSSRFPVGLVSRPLVVKRGGHADQLSRRFWGMDRFRVASLVKLLECQPLGADRRRATVEVLIAKCAILAAGAEKRGRAEEARSYRALAALYGAESVNGKVVGRAPRADLDGAVCDV